MFLIRDGPSDDEDEERNIQKRSEPNRSKPKLWLQHLEIRGIERVSLKSKA